MSVLTIDERLPLNLKLVANMRLISSARRAFTLIELLIVIAIIGILASLIMPALAGAKTKAVLMKCINNQRQIGIAMKMYVDDHSDLYPAYDDWATWGGQKGTNSLSSGEVAGNSLHGGNVDPTNRVLNPYIKNLEVCRCPADKGDPLWKIKSCWQGWGNCYLFQWYYDEFGVEHIGGKAVKNVMMTKPTKSSRIAQRPATKIVLGDWTWFGDRTLNDPNTVWHRQKGKRVTPIPRIGLFPRPTTRPTPTTPSPILTASFGRSRVRTATLPSASGGF